MIKTKGLGRLGIVNFFLDKINLELSRTVKSYALGYISAKETISAAEKEGLSVGNYLENLWGLDRGRIINSMKEFGAIGKDIKDICEIGTGSGMFLEKIIEQCDHKSYESYEPKKDWAEWLASKYNIISHNADGNSLVYTTTSSIDLIHSHGVFIYLPFLTSYQYFQEFDRVIRKGGYLVFDIFSEDCFNDEIVISYLQTKHRYPVLLPKNLVIKFFDERQFLFIGDFQGWSPNYVKGTSIYLVFRKQS
jgi:hypothetical protein